MHNRGIKERGKAGSLKTSFLHRLRIEGYVGRFFRQRKGEKEMQFEGLPENNTVLLTGTIVEGCVFSHEVYGEGF